MLNYGKKQNFPMYKSFIGEILWKKKISQIGNFLNKVFIYFTQICCLSGCVLLPAPIFLCDLYENPLWILWDNTVILLWFLCDLYEIPLWFLCDSLWFLYDFYMICIWFVYDFYMICIWFLCDCKIICKKSPASIGSAEKLQRS